MHDTDHINKLLAAFISKSQHASELVRIANAKKLAAEWMKSGLPLTLFPANPNSSDYWYLTQLLALHRHVDETNFRNDSRFFVEKELEIISESPLSGRAVSRLEIDTYLRTHSEDHIRLPSIDEALRLFAHGRILSTSSLHIDGYWDSSSEGKIGLFVSFSQLSGSPVIDGIWNNTKLKSVRVLFVRESREKL